MKTSIPPALNTRPYLLESKTGPLNTGQILGLAALAAPSADNSQPFTLLHSENSISLNYDLKRVGGVTFAAASQPNFIAAGAALENMLKVADSAGISLQYQCDLEHTATTNHYFSVEFAASADGNRQFPDHPAFQRQTNRFPYQQHPIPEELLNTLSDISEGQARTLVFTEPSDKKGLHDLVRRAGEIRFQTQEVHEFLGKSLRFTRPGESKDGLELSTLDLPPGGGLFMRFISSWNRMNNLNKLGAYKLLARIDAKPIARAPAILAFVATDSPQGSFDAGRCMERAWIELNSNGIACHPYYVVSDQLNRLGEGKVPVKLTPQAKAIKSSCEKVFELKENETVVMLMRTGYPKKMAPRSGRLPLDAVYKNLSEETD